MIEWKNQIEAQIELEEQNKPIYSEKPVDPELQTGDSKKLGGEMRLTAPWFEHKK